MDTTTRRGRVQGLVAIVTGGGSLSFGWLLILCVWGAWSPAVRAQPVVVNPGADDTSSASSVRVAVEETPDWVVPRSWEAPVAGPAPIGVPYITLLWDTQSRLRTGDSAYYMRWVVQLKNIEGVRRFAEWTRSYSPEYEKVILHRLQLKRGDLVLDRLRTAQFRKLQREERLEHRIYDGRITIATVIEDVRVGDILEFAYTLHSNNPVLGDYIGGTVHLGDSAPIQRAFARVDTPRDRTTVATFFLPEGTASLPAELYRLSALKLALETTETVTSRVYEWKGENLPAIPFEANISPRAAPYFPVFQVRSFVNWTEMVDWARGLFQDVGVLPDDALAWVKACRAEHSTPTARLGAAVRWVQRDVRYFGMAFGSQNLRPRKLREICSTRFGDCKDKSALLVAMLRALDIEAWPVLVNTNLKQRVLEFGPSPSAFDHAIVVCRIDGRDCWIDPTIEHQEGLPGRWAVPPYKLGLIIREGVDAPTPIVDTESTDVPDTTTEDDFKVQESGDATLVVTTKIRGLQADYYRQSLASSGLAEVGLRWLNFIGRFYPKIEEMEAVRVQDDPEKNIITLVASYRLPQFATKRDDQTWLVNVYAYSLRAVLDVPDARRRRWPYALWGGRSLLHRMKVDLPFEVPFGQSPLVVACDELEYRVEKGLAGRQYVAEHALQIRQDFVAADRMPGFVDSATEIVEAIGSSIVSTPPAPPTETAPRSQ